MSPARIKPRELSNPCRVCGKTKHLQVVFRMGGRGFREIAAGSFHYEKDARARRDFVSGELAAGRDPREGLRALATVAAPTLGLEQLAAAYEQSRIDYEDATAKSIGSHLRKLVEVFGADTDPAAITVTGCIDAVATLDGELSPVSVSKYWTTFRQLLDYAAVDPNPARDARVKLPRIVRREPDPPSAAHVLAILDKVTPRWVLPFITIEQTAMAIGEVAKLEWGDVDVPGCRFRLRRETVKGQIAARARWIQVPGWLMELIEDTCPPEDRAATRRVFAGVNVDSAGDAMERACKTAKIPHYTPHKLRHRRLSLWHGQGIPAKELAARAGHSDAWMTLNVYSHVMPLEEISQARLLELAGRSR